ncbi:hypothetical protein NP233_g1581 [Leucocoprinus birnbaumii]|uniref:Cytochrome b561 domain-containing protein n=1 Tax=Leucocoprinus birnbaumii TaxID=56174 RepID=A0AAD5VZQ5_9AGAR|nr:hypothetical protein NP233_g1581 [Leucocoprinus birnbaumii]
MRRTQNVPESTMNLSSGNGGGTSISRLPADILIEVFRFASGHYLGMYGARNAICAVSRRWREVAIGFPGLWTEVYIDASVGYPPLPLLKMWLERSRDAPLFIRLECLIHFFVRNFGDDQHWQPDVPLWSNEDETMLYTASALAAVSMHIHRWKLFLYVMLPPAGEGPHNSFLLDRVAFRDATQLEVLKIATSVRTSTELKILRAIEKLPRLRKVDWRISSQTLLCRNVYNFPWHRLEHISLSGNIKHVAYVVAQCTSAITLNLFSQPDALIQTQPEMTYFLPVLKGLDFQCYRDGLRLLREIQCPNLEILRLRLVGHDPEDEEDEEVFWDNPDDYDELWEHLFSFLDDNSHKLRILQIEESDKYIPPDILSKILLRSSRMMKDLYGLHITVEAANESIYQTIRGFQTDLTLLVDGSLPGPLLERFQVTEHGDRYFHVGWVREELKGFERECGYVREMSYLMEKFHELCKPGGSPLKDFEKLGNPGSHIGDSGSARISVPDSDGLIPTNPSLGRHVGQAQRLDYSREMGSDDLIAKRQKRDGDALASSLVWAGVLAMTVTTWSIVFLQGFSSFRYFTYHLLLQPVAIGCFSYGILTLQPTNQPKTKAAGLERHQNVIFTVGFPAMALGSLAVAFNKYLRDYPHFVTSHAQLGLACSLWAVVQLCVGFGTTWNDGVLFGGGARAKALWKYHRLSGYILFGLMLFTCHLGGGWSDWGQNYTNDLVRFVAYTLSPIMISAGVCLRTVKDEILLRDRFSLGKLQHEMADRDTPCSA